MIARHFHNFRNEIQCIIMHKSVLKSKIESLVECLNRILVFSSSSTSKKRGNMPHLVLKISIQHLHACITRAFILIFNLNL